MKQCFIHFLREESGSTATEYGLVMTLISVVAIASMIAIGGSVSVFLGNALAAFSR